MKIKALGTDREDINNFVNHLLANIDIGDFPHPDILAQAIEMVKERFKLDMPSTCFFLASPQLAFNQKLPLQVLKESDGIGQLEQLLRRIEQGIPI